MEPFKSGSITASNKPAELGGLDNTVSSRQNFPTLRRFGMAAILAVVELRPWTVRSRVTFHAPSLSILSKATYTLVAFG